jgi:hypothetical protein
MPKAMIPNWLDWAQRLQAIAQNGLHYARDLCELIGGEPAHSVETDGVGFFREDELPELSVMRVTLGQIARLFQHHRHPDWPTDFD